MPPQEQEYRGYHGTQPPPRQTYSPSPEQKYQLDPLLDIDTLSPHIHFLKEKYQDDLEEAHHWNFITKVASIAGYILILIGVVLVIISSIFSGLGTGLVTGGLVSLSGVVINIFTNLIINPAKIANERVEADAKLLFEEYQSIAAIKKREIEIEQFKISIEALPARELQELLIQFIKKEYGLSNQS